MTKLLMIIPFFVLAACELVVDIDVPQTGGQLSISGLVASDSTWRIDVRRSRGILEFATTFDSVTNATITITDETAGTSVSLTHQYYGRYRANEMPVPGHRYSITVDAPGYETLTGSTVIPKVVELKNVELDTTKIIRYTLKGGRWDETHPLRFTLSDVAETSSTYETQVIASVRSRYLTNGDGGDTVTNYYSGFAITYLSDPSLVDKKDFFDTDPNSHRFSDDSFAGQDKVIEILVPTHVFGDHYGGGGYFGTTLLDLTVRVYDQGYEYAKFVDTRNVQRDTEGDPFAQPAPVYSNLNNRNGIFAVKTASTIEWNFDPDKNK